MAVTPSGRISGLVRGMRDLIAACDTFQSWCGIDADDVDAVDQAKARVYEWEVTEANAMRPFALVLLGEQQLQQSIARTGGSGTVFRFADSIGVVFEAEIPADYAAAGADGWFWFCNNVGAIEREMESLVNTDAHPGLINAKRRVYGPARAGNTEKRSRGDIMQIAYEFNQGLKG